MDKSMGTGLMAVFAISGSVVLLALQAHKRILSDFMNKIECEIGPSKNKAKKKKVRFADEKQKSKSSSHPKKAKAVVGKRVSALSGRCDDEKLDSLPPNWQALYKGILEYKSLRGHF